MDVSLEKLIQLVTAEVVKELGKQGVRIVSGSFSADSHNSGSSLRTKVERIDMKKYRTPILTEKQIRNLHELTGEVIVPPGTVMTPKAKELVRERRLVITIQS